MQHAYLRRSSVALNALRRVRAARTYTQRTLTTATEADSLDIDFPPPLPELDSKSSGDSSISAHRRAVFVRPWDGISSMPELLAIVRGLERHYGRIREYGVVRDFDLNSQYMPYFWINFEDPASFARVPETPSLLKLDVPRIDLARPGGIGLEDLQGLLQPDDYVSTDEVFNEVQSQTVDKSTKRGPTVTVDVRVERAKIPFSLRGGSKLPQVNRAFVGAFYGWGGFYRLPAPDVVHPAPTMQMGVSRRKSSAKEFQKVERKGDEVAEGTEDVELGSMGEETGLSLEEISRPDGLGAATTPITPEAEAAGPAQAKASSSVMSAATSVSTPIVNEADPEPATPRLSKREQILARARANARTPLPESLLQTEQKRRQLDEEKLAQEREEEQVRISVRERLWKMIGSKWS